MIFTRLKGIYQSIMSIEADNRLCDIYSIRQVIEPYNSSVGKWDSECIIFLSRSKMKEKFPLVNNHLVCNDCKCNCLFIYDSSSGPLCPKCFYKRHGGGSKRKCSWCNKRLGCDSCGGGSTYMVEPVDGLVLCTQDKCLMPFKYRFSVNESLVCSCERLIYNKLNEHMISVLHDIIGEWLFGSMLKAKDKDVNSPRTVILPDLSRATNNNQCISCTVNSRYTDVSYMRAHSWVNLVCGCTNVDRIS